MYDDYAPYRMIATLEDEGGRTWTKINMRQRSLFGKTDGYMQGKVVRNPDNGKRYRVTVVVSLMQREANEREDAKRATMAAKRQAAKSGRRGRFVI